MLLGILVCISMVGSQYALGTRLLGDIVAVKGIKRAGKGVIRAGDRAAIKKQGRGIVRAGHGNKMEY